MFRGRPFLRFLVLLLAISATLLVSTVAASPAHFHKDSYGGGCDICVIAHLPVVQPALSVHIFAPGTSDPDHRQTVALHDDPFIQFESLPRASAPVRRPCLKAGGLRSPVSRQYLGTLSGGYIVFSTIFPVISTVKHDCRLDCEGPVPRGHHYRHCYRSFRCRRRRRYRRYQKRN